MTVYPSLIGRRFGRLLVLRKLPNDKFNQITWECQCDCGTVKAVVGAYMRSGTKSCGCLKREVDIDKIKKSPKIPRFKHGAAHKPEYQVYWGMRARCYNQNHSHFYLYGGRGIIICDRWISDFSNFYVDMGPRPSARHSIDRIDNNGNYEPGNCRWATVSEQSNNKSTNRMVEYNGCSMSLTDAIRISGTGIKYRTVMTRLRGGWDVVAAIETPLTRPSTTYRQGAMK